MTNAEIWKPIRGYENRLEISSLGRVRSNSKIKKGQVIAVESDTKGYLRIRTTISGKRTNIKVHRAVAEAFIENPLSKEQVNHKDGNKKNNAVENLEWVTNKENANHAIKAGLWDTVIRGSILENNSRKIPIVAKNGDSVLYFTCVSDAERYFNSRHICDVLKGRRSHVCGYSFWYRGGDGT